uniref:tRNA nucleotidyltransferase/poly(A) polymerase RNA and SrmB- binding domain-containing protein n=1 Tax=Salix viminalis TaxID=40686 RepID=A0A6N2NJW4_SALVM
MYSVLTSASVDIGADSRILRAVRIAARLGFRFTRETAHFIKNLSRSLLRLDNQRIMMEMNYMLAYGSAEASLRILWKFGLLELLLPFQHTLFVMDLRDATRDLTCFCVCFLTWTNILHLIGHATAAYGLES